MNWNHGPCDCCGENTCWYVATRCECCDQGGAVAYVRCSDVGATTLYFKHRGSCYFVDNTHSTVSSIPDIAGLANLSDGFASCEACCDDSTCDVSGCGGVWEGSTIRLQAEVWDFLRVTETYDAADSTCQAYPGTGDKTFPLPSTPACGDCKHYTMIAQYGAFLDCDVVVPYVGCIGGIPTWRGAFEYAHRGAFSQTGQTVGNCDNQPFYAEQLTLSNDWQTSIKEITIELSGGNWVVTTHSYNFSVAIGSPCNTPVSVSETSSTDTESTLADFQTCGESTFYCYRESNPAASSGLYRDITITPNFLLC